MPDPDPFDQFEQPAQGEQGGSDPLDQFDHPQGVGMARQILGGINKTAVGLATLPYEGVRAAVNEGAQRLENYYHRPQGYRLPAAEDMPLYSWALKQPEPVGIGEKLARATGEGIGSFMLPEAALAAKAEQLAGRTAGQYMTNPASTSSIRGWGHDASVGLEGTPNFKNLKPRTATGELARQMGERLADKPLRAIATDLAYAGASGASSETAKEAGYGPGTQMAAGMLAPAAAIGAPIAAARAIRPMLGISSGAFTPTEERFKVWAGNLFKNLGIHASADGLPAGETEQGQAAAYKLLANVLQRANVSPDNLDWVLNRLSEARYAYPGKPGSWGQDVAALADLDPSLQKFLGSLMRQHPEVWKRAVDFFYARQTGITPPRGDLPHNAGLPYRDEFSVPMTAADAEAKFGTTFGTPTSTKPPSIVPMGMRDRVLDMFRRDLLLEDVNYHGHSPTAGMTDAQLVEQQKAAAAPLYSAAREAGQGVDLRPHLDPILERWLEASERTPSAARAKLNSEINEVLRLMDPRLNTTDPITRNTSTAFERFDAWKQQLDEEIGNWHDAPPGNRNRVLAEVMNKFKNELLSGVKDEADGETLIPGLDQIETNDLGAKYHDARAKFSSLANAQRAIKTGREIWKGKAGLDEYHSLDGDDASQKLVRLGLHGGAEEETQNMPAGHDVTKIFDKPRLRDVLAEIIPRSKKADADFHYRPERFGKYIANERMMQGTAKRTYQGSPTAERIEDDKAANELFNLAEQIKEGGAKKVLSNFAGNMLNKYFGYRADTAATLGRVLLSADPKIRSNAIAQLRRHMAPDRFTFFERVMNEQGRRAVVGGAASSQEGNQ